jgi:hypothetical protein
VNHRKLYDLGKVKMAADDAVLCKYMEWWKFESMVTTGSLYFCRIDNFDDSLEGRAPQAIWTLSASPMKQWYATNREHVFVCCLHLAEAESLKMWKAYAANEGVMARGVMIRTTVGALLKELSFPELPEEPPYTETDPTPHDGFSVGVVDYVDLDTFDVWDLLAEGLSNTTPMFRKGKGYIDELEYRAILRPGSVTGEEARKVGKDGKDGVEIKVRLDQLIQEIRFAPVDDPSFKTDIEQLLGDAGLTIPVLPSSLGIKNP